MFFRGEMFVIRKILVLFIVLAFLTAAGFFQDNKDTTDETKVNIPFKIIE